MVPSGLHIHNYIYFAGTYAHAFFSQILMHMHYFFSIAHAHVYNTLAKIYDRKYVIHLEPSIFFL